MNKHGKIFSILCVILMMSLLLTSCSGRTASFSGISDNVYTVQDGDAKYHTPSLSSETICKSDYITMSIDKSTYTVNISDASANCTWHSLFPDSNKNSYAFATLLYTPDGIYFLNTQDNSVAFGTAKYKVTDNSVTVSYVLSDKAETAKKSYDTITKSDIYLAFSVTYTLYAQSVSVSINLGDMKCTPDSFIGVLSFLPDFGSHKNMTDGDYILVPDNSGAVIYTNGSDAATDNVSVSVYGNDGYYSTEESASASIPVFGMKYATGGFAAIIEDADALCVINASRNSADSGANVGAAFTVTPVYSPEGSEKTYYGKSYNGNIKVVYKFLSDDDADYIGMAKAAREEFINNNMLVASDDGNLDSIPFMLTLVGTFLDTDMTTSTQAQDIMSVIQGKGIDDITLRYKGLLQGGMIQNNLYSSDINSSLGGKSGLESLHDYLVKQNNSLYLDVNIMSSSNKYSLHNSSSSIYGGRGTTKLINDFALKSDTNLRLSTRIGEQTANEGLVNANAALYKGEKYYDGYTMKLSVVSDKFISFIGGKYSDITDGYSLGDAGRLLYSDAGYTRQDARNAISELTRAVTNEKLLSVETGNIYTLYNATMVTGLNFDTYYAESDLYEPVPFSQAVLHGYVGYSGVPIDVGNALYKYNMLQSIEYGAVPSFEWVYDNSSIFYYGYYASGEVAVDIVNYYKNVNDILGGLESETIVSHKKITTDATGKSVSGVYCTGYSNGTEIYVNYTGGTVTTDGNIVVKPYDCTRVDR